MVQWLFRWAMQWLFLQLLTCCNAHATAALRCNAHATDVHLTSLPGSYFPPCCTACSIFWCARRKKRSLRLLWCRRQTKRKVTQTKTKPRVRRRSKAGRATRSYPTALPTLTMTLKLRETHEREISEREREKCDGVRWSEVECGGVR